MKIIWGGIYKDDFKMSSIRRALNFYLNWGFDKMMKGLIFRKRL